MKAQPITYSSLLFLTESRERCENRNYWCLSSIVAQFFVPFIFTDLSLACIPKWTRRRIFLCKHTYFVLFIPFPLVSLKKKKITHPERRTYRCSCSDQPQTLNSNSGRQITGKSLIAYHPDLWKQTRRWKIIHEQENWLTVTINIISQSVKYNSHL